MDKLKKIPHKILFYFGLLTVFIFLGLSFWQFSSFQDDNAALEQFKNTNLSSPITIEELYLDDSDEVFEFNKVVIIDKNNLVKKRTWYLRSRVNNGENGYHLINLYKDKDTDNYLIVNNGWIPLDKNENKSTSNQEILFIGRLIKYDQQTFGQDDVPNSEYLFRIDKNFIENEVNVTLPNYYLTLTETCGSGVECINLEEPYDAPHLSYALQWLFFAVCLIVVIFRKNNLI